ncbi:MAG: GNAT family N-acetyltransferase [Cyanobacteria bacterium]|nr:GNAT family N-acetyltransferase [Cyanobacteriota bacterium]
MSNHSPTQLSATLHNTWQSITAEEWGRLFPATADSPQMLAHNERSGFDGVSFFSLVVSQRDPNSHKLSPRELPILYIPLFLTPFDVPRIFDPAIASKAQAVLKGLPNWVQKWFYPTLLGVGFLECEWGEVGFDRTVSDDVLKEAWALAIQALDKFSQAMKVDLQIYSHFNPLSSQALIPEALQGYCVMDSPPIAMLSMLGLSSLDEYFETLSYARRKNIRRKLKAAKEIRVEWTTDPTPWIADIYSLYLTSRDAGEAMFTPHREDFFARICQEVPGARYALYFKGDRLLAFNLLVHYRDRLVDKFFCKHPQEAAPFNLYFVSWVENIRHCIEHQIPLYYAGSWLEAVKEKLGARFLPSYVAFHHRHPFLNWLFPLIQKFLTYQPQVSLPQYRLGYPIQAVQDPQLLSSLTLLAPGLSAPESVPPNLSVIP